jgi:hypothetical protein
MLRAIGTVLFSLALCAYSVGVVAKADTLAAFTP